MGVLLVGSGAREHILAEMLKKSGAHVYSFGARNPGIEAFAQETCVGKLTDTAAILSFAVQKKIDFAVIGPEVPLAAGVVDVLASNGIPSVGPGKALAQIEASKSFTRQLLEKHDIDASPRFMVFTSLHGVKEFMQLLNGNYVVKADGLRSGKGVKVSGEHLKTIDEGAEYCAECLKEDGKVVVEEKLVGQEFSLMFFADGKNVVKMPAVQDHKRAHEDDTGPNTGGMGTYSDADHMLPFLSSKDITDAERLTRCVVDALSEIGEYKGILYGGFMATADGVKLIEYNARFGDPEVLNVLSLLKTDFVKVCQDIICGRLRDVSFERKATVCKYVVPQGYPDNPVQGKIVVPKGNYYYAAVEDSAEGMMMTGSRAVACVGVADSIADAEQQAEQLAQQVQGNVFHRRDIGTAALIQKRVEHMKRLRGEK